MFTARWPIKNICLGRESPCRCGPLRSRIDRTAIEVDGLNLPGPFQLTADGLASHHLRGPMWGWGKFNCRRTDGCGRQWRPKAQDVEKKRPTAKEQQACAENGRF